MTSQNQILQQFQFKLLAKRAFQGALISFTLVTLFLFFIGALNDGAWVLLPITTVTIGGACGGVFFYLATDLVFRQGTKRIIAIILSALVYAVGVWMSLIIALAITGHWD